VTQPDTLKSLLRAVAQGELSPDRALEDLKYLQFEAVGDFAKLDHHRHLRTGFPEVIWGPGKSVPQLVEIFRAMHPHTPLAMATRIEPEVYTALQAEIPYLVYYSQARICALRNLALPADRPLPLGMTATIGLLAAGTADLPVAEEAAVTAELCGFSVQRFWDVGVAGLHRLLNQLRTIAAANVLIVVAGMEGALPSVVAGLVDSPVIAVPTSVGYGTHLQGIAPLLTMLNSCATGIGVVNIDNGFGAAILAGQILRSAAKLQRKSSE